MPIHVTTSTNQTITGAKTFTGLISAASGFTFPDGTTQTTAFTGGAATPGDRLDNGTVQVVLSSDNNLVFPGGGYIGSQYGAAGWIVTPPAAGGIASADGEQYIQINNGQGIFIGTSWPASPHEWTFGRDGNLTFPDGTIQTTAFTNNLSTYAELSYVDNNFLNLTGGTVSGSVAIDGDVTIASILSTANVIYASGGNSDEWNNTYTTVNANSATTWNYQGTDIKSLTATWQNTTSAFNIQSPNNVSVYSTVNSNSASWAVDSTVDTGVRALTSNWQNTFTTVNTNSASWGTGGSNVQFFTTNGTWTNPSPNTQKPIKVVMCGGGGGGGGGSRLGWLQNRYGGTGGAAGAVVEFYTTTTQLSSTQSVIVGAGGTGATAIVNPTVSNGGNGSAGGTSLAFSVSAVGGGGGNGGYASGGAGPAVGAAVSNSNNIGLAVSTPAAGAASSTSFLPTGGGGGGSIDTNNTPYTGSAGGSQGNSAIGVLAGGTLGAIGTNGGAGSTTRLFGTGGGGGGGRANGAAGNGGNGGGFGSGGGGGGAAQSSSNVPANDVYPAGAGGNGSQGFVLIITY